MRTKFDIAVVIGRFQIPHNAHIDLIRTAASQANKVVVIIGSAGMPRSFKNPFTASERECMLRRTLGAELGDKLAIAHSYDNVYNNAAWAANIQRIVRPYEETPWTDKPKSVAIFGCKKDRTSFYLNMFPQWTFVPQAYAGNLDATEVRNRYFCEEGQATSDYTAMVPSEVAQYLVEFRELKRDAFDYVVSEHVANMKYRKPYEALPYPPTFVTTDAVVVQSGHVLLIKRRSAPGRGLWALPGGFLNADTDPSLEDAMIRELREETGLKIPDKVLRGSIVSQRTIDAIDRSPRGRTITTVYRIDLDDDNPLPKVRGMDDAEKAKWVPFSEIDREVMFEDHYAILQVMLGLPD